MSSPLHRIEREELQDALDDDPSMIARWREHKYIGGPPGERLRRMQSNHEVRARQHGVVWDLVDLRLVYRHHQGLCGICKEPVSLETVAFDRIIPIEKRGPHTFENLQPAHFGCNSSKGAR